jgi:hypothetical protein
MIRDVDIYRSANVLIREHAMAGAEYKIGLAI